MMEFLRFILTVPVLVALVAFPVSTQEGTEVLIACSDDAHYANGSTYATNLKSVLSLISANNPSSYGFYNISTGENTDKVYAVSLCRGDISQSNCNSCLDFATTDIYSRCPTQKAAIAWYDNCMLRFSNQSILGTLDPIYHTSFNPDNVSNPDLFNRALSTLLNDLRDQASLGNSSIKFAVGDTNYTNFGRIYALVQCTPDLSSQDCGKCLDWAFTHLSGVSFTIGGRVFCGSCNIRYEIFQFYSPGDSLLPQPSPPNPVNCANEETTNIMWTVIITVLSTIGSMILITCILLFVHARWKRDADEAERPKFLQFDFESVKAGTNDFSDDNKLGQGGFGAVYQGKHVDGQLLAVKRLASGSNQGDVEFKNEVLLLTKLQHKNLVRLLGFCLEGEERLLIYEFMPNGSLDQFLFDPFKRQDLDWETRYKIICGIARGLLYLHEDSSYRVIHRDLKASNVLLDEDMTPKIADFGLARLFPDDQTKGQTNQVVGTYGYMAPEYGLHGQFSVKSDVYSFGVLVLEIVSGQKNTHLVVEETAEDLISFAWGSWRAGTAPDIIDPALRDGSSNEIVHCIHIGLLCVQESVALRPNMASVAALLNGYSITLPAPAVPAFYLQDDNESEMPMLGRRSTGTNSSDQFQGQSGNGNYSVNGISNSDMYLR